MRKSKKHFPKQSEVGSIEEQVPQDKMDKLIDGLIELAQKKEARSKESNSQNEG